MDCVKILQGIGCGFFTSVRLEVFHVKIVCSSFLFHWIFAFYCTKNSLPSQVHRVVARILQKFSKHNSPPLCLCALKTNTCAQNKLAIFYLFSFLFFRLGIPLLSFFLFLSHPLCFDDNHHHHDFNSPFLIFFILPTFFFFYLFNTHCVAQLPTHHLFYSAPFPFARISLLNQSLRHRHHLHQRHRQPVAPSIIISLIINSSSPAPQQIKMEKRCNLLPFFFFGFSTFSSTPFFILLTCPKAYTSFFLKIRAITWAKHFFEMKGSIMFLYIWTHLMLDYLLFQWVYKCLTLANTCFFAHNYDLVK